MIGLFKWMQLKLADKVDNIWCIHCGKKRTVIRHGVVEMPNSNRLAKRMVGTCTVCEGATSTFV